MFSHPVSWERRRGSLRQTMRRTWEMQERKWGMCLRTKTKREKWTEEEVDRDQTFCLFSLGFPGQRSTSACTPVRQSHWHLTNYLTYQSVSAWFSGFNSNVCVTAVADLMAKDQPVPTVSHSVVEHQLVDSQDAKIHLWLVNVKKLREELQQPRRLRNTAGVDIL